MEVICYLFGAHFICAANSIVRDDEWSCSGECFELVCFLFSSISDISLQMLDIYLFIVIGYGQVKGSIIDKRKQY